MAGECELMLQPELLEDVFPEGNFQVEGEDVVSVEELPSLLGYDIWHKFVAYCDLDWTDDGLQMHVGSLVVTTSDYEISPMNPSHADIAEDAELSPEMCFGGILCIDHKTGKIRIDDFFTASSVGVRLSHRFSMACELALAVSEEVGVTVIQSEA